MTKKTKKKKTPDSYVQRVYRQGVDPGGLTAFEVTVRETDLQILASGDFSEQAQALVLQCRSQLENYLVRHPRFLTALSPYPADPLAPSLVKSMLAAGLQAEVGPMAAVAGAIAEYVGRGLLALGCKEVVVENGGDIFLARATDSTVAVFAGESSLSNRVGMRVSSARQPLGVCTSSATVGHSLSFGRADAVTVLANPTALADAAATAIGNEVGRPEDIDKALAKARTIEGVQGVVIIIEDRLGAWGDVELVRLG